jgi:hypothetical protein
LRNEGCLASLHRLILNVVVHMRVPGKHLPSIANKHHRQEALQVAASLLQQAMPAPESASAMQTVMTSTLPFAATLHTGVSAALPSATFGDRISAASMTWMAALS